MQNPVLEQRGPWQKVKDTSSDKTYFVKPETGESQWDPPAEFLEPAKPKSSSPNRLNAASESNGAAAPRSGSPSSWNRGATGSKGFYNPNRISVGFPADIIKQIQKQSPNNSPRDDSVASSVPSNIKGEGDDDSSDDNFEFGYDNDNDEVGALRPAADSGLGEQLESLTRPAASPKQTAHLSMPYGAPAQAFTGTRPISSNALPRMQNNSSSPSLSQHRARSPNRPATSPRGDESLRNLSQSISNVLDLQGEAKFQVGARVVYKNEVGVVRFCGPISERSPEHYVGIELYVPRGDCDGMHKKSGRRFFNTSSNHGLFIPVDEVLGYQGRSGATMEGYLTKQGGRVKTWKLRWCVLIAHQKRLDYFKAPTDTEPKDSISNLPSYELLNSGQVKRKNGWGLRPRDSPNGRIYVFVCASAIDRDLWMSAVAKCL